MEEENKLQGTVNNFDGFAGVIKTENGEYIFNKHDLVDEDISIKENDTVSFVENTVVFGDESTKVAKFIDKEQ